MHQKLTTVQIEAACREALGKPGRTSVRAVMLELRSRFGACGRTERIAAVLRDVTEQHTRLSGSGAGASDVPTLLNRVSVAESRAARAEELERRHQDFWAGRYQAKLSELADRTREAPSADVPFDEYLQLYRKAAELARRLSHYEEVGELMESTDSTGPGPATDTSSV